MGKVNAMNIKFADHFLIDCAPLVTGLPEGRCYLVEFVYHPALERWLSSTGASEFRLLTTEVVNCLLEEAIKRKLALFGVDSGVIYPLQVVEEDDGS
jgi:hypothetical protein